MLLNIQITGYTGKFWRSLSNGSLSSYCRFKCLMQFCDINKGIIQRNVLAKKYNGIYYEWMYSGNVHGNGSEGYWV